MDADHTWENACSRAITTIGMLGHSSFGALLVPSSAPHMRRPKCPLSRPPISSFYSFQLQRVP